MRVVQLTFYLAWHARATAHKDDEEIGAFGYQCDSPPGEAEARKAMIAAKSPGPWLDWSHALWRRTGFAPFANFYVAAESPWIDAVAQPKRIPKGSEYRWWHTNKARHYVLWGRNGHVEALAERYSWREWLWTSDHRDTAISTTSVIAEGAGVD